MVGMDTPMTVFAAGFMAGMVAWATVGEWVVRSLARRLARQ